MRLHREVVLVKELLGLVEVRGSGVCRLIVGFRCYSNMSDLVKYKNKGKAN